MTLNKNTINSKDAPQAIGTYSQAISVIDANTTIYLSGQIPLVANTMDLISDDISEQIHQVFKNISAVCKAAEGSLADIVKLNVYLTNLVHFGIVNKIMATYFTKPYPARAVIGVKQLPKDSLIEIDAIMCIDKTTPFSY